LVHTWPAPHAWPQVPQFALSPCRSTQAPADDALAPQTEKPVAQPQAPAEHDAPVAQAFPQPLQLAGSTCVSTQLVPHTVLGETQGPVSVLVSETAPSGAAESSPVSVVVAESSLVSLGVVSGDVESTLPSSVAPVSSTTGTSVVELPHPAAARPKAPSASGSHHRVLRMQPPKLPSTFEGKYPPRVEG
jgi:hypothetical protein